MKEINNKKEKNKEGNIKENTKINIKTKNILWLSYGRVSSWQQVKD
ncbi:MAG: hypothetical protein LBJ14_08140 [Desulfarculales bacterium]|jgi:hypothetical protein|nr:hypothetical protein [Desulfarculales bacterium]